MKMTISQRIMAVALAICLVLTMIPSAGLIPEVEAAANQWTAIAGAATRITADTVTPFNASFNSYVTAYYDQKIDVVNGTKIAFKVNFPAITDGLLLQYAFSLVNRAGSFYTSDTLASSLSLELVGNINTLTATASKKPAGATARTFLQTFASSLANPRNTTDVYDVTFEKIDVTEGGVNYSWKLTVSKPGGTAYSYRYKATDIPHDMFANGAYLALGSMAGSTTHTVRISDLSVKTETTPPEPPAPPAADPAGWNTVAGAAAGLTPESEGAFNASFKNYVTGYYNNKIAVEENTTISFKVNFPAISDGVLMQYAFSLMDQDKSFYTSNTTANSMSVELTSTVTNGTANPLSVTASKKAAGATARTFLSSLTTGLGSRSTTDVYDVTFKKINVTEDGVNYSWRLTVANGTTSYTYMYKATDISHDLFKNGVYLALGSMAGSTTHTVKVSDLKVEVKADEPPAPPTPPTPPPADPAGWNVLQGTAAGLTPESEGAFNASFKNYVTGYYNDKITVEENTTISFKVKFPAISDGVLLQYAFSLVDQDKSFYNSNTTANSMSAELTSAIANGAANPVSVTASKKAAGATSRTFLSSLTTDFGSRSTTDVYDVTFKKVNVTEDGVNYSWKLVVTKDGYGYSYLYKATDIPHDLFANGAYLAFGSMAGSTTHTLQVSDLKVEVNENDIPVEPPVVPPVTDPAGWNAVAGTAAGLIPESTGAFNASFKNYVTGYYNEKITVEDGTAISFKVKFPAIADGTALHYGFSIMDAAKSFYQNGAANALSVEIQSQTEVENKWPVRAVLSKKVAGGSNRTWMANVPETLLADRTTDEVYTITLQKISGQVDGVEYSWMITVRNGGRSQTSLVTAAEISHDLFADGLYLAAGSMIATSTHTMQISDLTVKKESYKLNDDAGWNAIGGAAENLVADGKNATFKNYITGYYNEKIAVQNGTTISLQVQLPAMKAGENLHYGFSLVDKAKSFYTSDTLANSLSVELQSMREVNKKWPVNAVVSRKDTGAGRAWMANLGSGVSVDRDTKAVYTITFRKINETVNGINYSWYVTISNGSDAASYGVKASDVPHDRFANGVYLAAGSMTSVCNHTMKITNTSAKVATDKFDTNKLVDLSGIWKIVRGYSGTTGKGLSYKDGNVTMEGYGGLAYMKDSVKEAVSVEFTLNKYNAKGSDFFSFGLVNKEGVYYNPNGKESQGIYVRIKEVQGKLSVTVYNLTKEGSVAVGELTSTTKAKGVKHFVTFFKEGSKWYVSLDGKQKMRVDEKVALKNVNYLVAGATMAKEQSMTVHKVTVDDAVTAGMVAGKLKSGFKVNGFQIVRGYGLGSPTTGTGLTNENGKTKMQGYGGITYTASAVKNAVAVDFTLDAYSGNSYFFSFGLLNKEGVYYNPNGQESQGIYVRIKSWVNGQGMNVTVYNMTAAGSEELGNIVTKVAPKGQKHNLSIFREDGVWYVGIDNYQKMQLNVDVALGKTSYLVAGASTTADLTMTVDKVYIDGQVTDAMKSGTVVMSAAADSQVGNGDTTGGTSTEKGQGDQFNTQEGNEDPGNLTDNSGNGQMIVWIACGVAACAVLVAVYMLFFMKKTKKVK